MSKARITLRRKLKPPAPTAQDVQAAIDAANAQAARGAVNITADPIQLPGTLTVESVERMLARMQDRMEPVQSRIISMDRDETLEVSRQRPTRASRSRNDINAELRRNMSAAMARQARAEEPEREPAALPPAPKPPQFLSMMVVGVTLWGLATIFNGIYKAVNNGPKPTAQTAPATSAKPNRNDIPRAGGS